MQIMKIAILGIAAILIAIQFKSNKSEYGIYISLVAAIIIFYFGITKLDMILETINKISGYISINQKFIAILIKIIGITYICEFASSLCKDAGYSAIASQIEVVGKLSILAISMPVLLALLETVNSFLG